MSWRVSVGADAVMPHRTRKIWMEWIGRRRGGGGDGGGRRACLRQWPACTVRESNKTSSQCQINCKALPVQYKSDRNLHNISS